jgi:predicted ATP-grasp superfamily ATP-dependent carboligase
MRLLIWEWCGSQPSSAGELAAEGFAMLTALATDAAALPGVDVVVVCDQRQSSPFPASVTVLPPREDDAMIELASGCDATLLIAPETDGLHARLAVGLEQAGVRLVGSSSTGIAACGDKLLLPTRLASTGLRSIPTSPFDASTREPPMRPCVIKPRFGAGGCDTFVCRSANDCEVRRRELERSENRTEFVIQPLVEGDSVSVAVLVSETHPPVVFPVVRQRMESVRQRIETVPRRIGTVRRRIESESRIRYLGGETAVDHPRGDALRAAALSAVTAIPGLRGWVGVDLIASANGDEPVSVCEINPRFTTSYVGYRQIARINLAEWWLGVPSRRSVEFENTPGVQFDKDGTVRKTAIDPPRRFGR